MSTHRVCCKCGCDVGDIVRPQPCDNSEAFGRYSEEHKINLPSWDMSCVPYFDCQYIKDKLDNMEEGQAEIAFAFSGACWFFDGSELSVDQCAAYGCALSCKHGTGPNSVCCSKFSGGFGCGSNDSDGVCRDCEEPFLGDDHDDADEQEEIFNYGFNLTGTGVNGHDDDPLNTELNGEEGSEYIGHPWSVEEVYTSCDLCMSDAFEDGRKVNELWLKLVLCDCQLDYESDGPDGIPNGQPPRPDDDDSGNVPDCLDDCDNSDHLWCERGFRPAGTNRPMYVPSRYVPDLILTDCCLEGTGCPGCIECITPEGCSEVLEKCHYWKEPITWQREGDFHTGRNECCMKSCTENNKPDWVYQIPCGTIMPNEDPTITTECHALGIWTPWHYHVIGGGIQNCHNCQYSATYWDRHFSYNHRYNPNNPETTVPHVGVTQRGCCSCCCGDPCTGPSSIGNWDYCRGFEGMETFEITTEFDSHVNCGGIHPDMIDLDPGTWCGPDNAVAPYELYGYPCPSGLVLLKYKFDLFPDVPDCIEGGGSEDDCVPYDPMLNVRGCMLLTEAAQYGTTPHCREEWGSETSLPDCDSDCGNCTNPNGNWCNIELGGVGQNGFNTCEGSAEGHTDPDLMGAWFHKIFSTSETTACSKHIDCWTIGDGNECVHNPGGQAVCPWCSGCPGVFEAICTGGPLDPPGCVDSVETQLCCCNAGNYSTGSPCCADAQNFCGGQPVYVEKGCALSPGGVHGYEKASWGLKWGHDKWCFANDPLSPNEQGTIMGFKMKFAETGGASTQLVDYPRVQVGKPENWRGTWGDAAGECCSEANLDNDCHEGDGCRDSCGLTAGRKTGFSAGWAAGTHSFCFIMPDNRVNGETGDCVPPGFLSLQEPAPMKPYGTEDTPIILGDIIPKRPTITDIGWRSNNDF